MTKPDKTLMGPSERANRRIILACGVLGGAIGLAMGLIGARQGEPAWMLNGPLPRWFALACVALWGGVLPWLSWRWHRVVDEHERQAYYKGTVAGGYLMGIGAPVWWLLWRGGMAPEVDAIVLYAAFIVVTGGAWMWHKYR